MRVTTYRGETSVGKIADKLFDGLTARKRKLAVAALLEANPRLKSVRKLPRGTVLTVPEVADLRPRKDEDDLRDPVGEVREDLTRNLQDYAKLQAAHHAEHLADLKSQDAALRDREFKKVVSASPPLVEMAKQVKVEIAARSQAAKVEQKALSEALKELGADLEKH